MKRRTFISLLPSAVALGALGPVPTTRGVTPWWVGTGFVPSGPIELRHAKICFEGMYPREGQTLFHNHGGLAPGWQRGCVLTRGRELELHTQTGWLWFDRPVHGYGFQRCSLPALPHPDTITPDSPFYFHA
jgi:hypothetical protein